MPTLNINYATSTALTITLASLANGSARASTAIDNGTNKYIDAALQLRIKLATGTPSGSAAIVIWFYGSEDGTNYGDNATGSDVAITLTTPTNLRGPFTLATPSAGGLTWNAVIGSVASYFGGVLPRKWGVVVQNTSGLALDAVEGNHTKTYSGITLVSS